MKNCSNAVSIVIILANSLSILQLVILSLLSTSPLLHFLFFSSSFFWGDSLCLILFFKNFSSLGLFRSCNLSPGALELVAFPWRIWLSACSPKQTGPPLSWGTPSWLGKGGRDTRKCIFYLLHEGREERHRSLTITMITVWYIYIYIAIVSHLF